MKTTKSRFKKKANIIFILSLIIFFSFSMMHINDYWVMDEHYFSKSAESILDDGKPYFYEGVDLKEKVELSHSPMMSYFIAGSFLVFGVSEASSRIVIILLNMITLFLMYMILNKFYSKPTYISLILFAIYPFIITSSILLDINGALFAMFLTLFSLVFIVYWNKDNIKSILILGIVLGLVVLSKFEGLFIIIPSIFLFYWLKKKDFLYSLKKTFFIGISGIIFFSFIWFCYTQFFSMDFFEIILHDLNEVNPRSMISFLIGQVWNLERIFFWFIPLIFIPVIYSFKERIKYFINNKTIEIEDFILILCVISGLFYILLIDSPYGYPKYLTIVLILFFIMIDKYMAKVNIPVLVVSFFFYLLLLKDSYLFEVIYMEIPITKMLIMLFSFILLIFIPCVVYLFLKDWKSITFALIIALALSTTVIQSIAGYSTIYYYGETGMIDAVDYIKENSDPEDVIVAPFDVGAYTKRPYIRAEPLIWSQRFDKEYVEKNDVKFIVARNKYSRYRPELERELSELSTNKKMFGNFVVYRVE